MQIVDLIIFILMCLIGGGIIGGALVLIENRFAKDVVVFSRILGAVFFFVLLIFTNNWYTNRQAERNYADLAFGLSLIK